MKKLLICLLLLPSLAWGEDYARMNPYVLGGGVAAPSAFCSSTTSTASISGVLCEDFDAGDNGVECASGYSSNCRATWTIDGGTPTFNSTGNSMGGTYALYLDANSHAQEKTSRSYAAQSEITIRALIKFDTSGQTGTREIAGANEIFCYIQVDGNIRCGTVNGWSPASVTAFSDNTLYYLWMYYHAASVSPGSDGIAWACLTTTDSPPADPATDNACSYQGNHQRTNTVSQIYFSNGGTGSEECLVKIDNIIIKAGTW